MSIISLGNFSRRCFRAHIYNTNQQWTRLYTYTRSSLQYHLNKSRDPMISYSFNKIFVPRSFSTPSSSNLGSKSKSGFIGWYLERLKLHPFWTKIVTTSLIYGAADVTAQIITSSPSDSYDAIRTVRMAGYGLLFLGPSQHVWFNFMSRALPKVDLRSTLTKIFLGQSVYGPANICCFFSYNAALQGESNEEIVARLNRDLLPTLKNGLAYWPICDFATYKFVPVHLQPLVNSSFNYLWTIYLTYMASLEKANTS